MNSIERNVEMRNIFSFLPPSSYLDTGRKETYVLDGEEITIPETDTRKFLEKFANHSSELQNILPKRLEALLSFSFITDTFKTYIAGVFNHDLASGIDEEEFIISDEGRLFPSGRKFFRDMFEWTGESGGIFDQTEAKNIETEAYRTAVHLQKGLERSYQEEKEGEDKKDLIENPLKVTQESREWVDKWKTNFIEQYSEEPCLI